MSTFMFQQKELESFLRGIGDEDDDDSVRLEVNDMITNDHITCLCNLIGLQVNMLVNYLEKTPPYINIGDGIPLTYSLLLQVRKIKFW